MKACIAPMGPCAAVPGASAAELACELIDTVPFVTGHHPQR